MANLIANRVLNQANDVYGGFLQYTEVNANRIILQTERGSTQHFEGSFTFDGNGVLNGGTITSFSEYLSDDSLWYRFSGISVPYQTFASYLSQGDFVGLQGFALQGSDAVNGSAEGDVLMGFAGSDTIFGNAGSDNINGNQGADIINGNQSNDTVLGGQDNDNVQGGQDDDFVNGNLGNDTVNGNLGDDTVHGGQGNDIVRGGQGNDQVFGNLGNDTLYGDKGNDALTGGDGADIFVFVSGLGTDIIQDFQDGVDKIQLQGLGISTFQELSGLISAGAGGHAIISFASGESITLTGIVPQALDAGDFIFG